MAMSHGHWSSKVHRKVFLQYTVHCIILKLFIKVLKTVFLARVMLSFQYQYIDNSVQNNYNNNGFFLNDLKQPLKTSDVYSNLVLEKKIQPCIFTKKNLVPEFTSLNSIYRQTQRHSQIISISKFLMNHFLNSAAIKCILSVRNN